MEPAVGEVWAYRARGVDPLTRVMVVRHGQRRPPRVLIRHEDEEMEALEEWVPPGRLKVPWDQVGELIAVEARWKAVQDLSADHDHDEARAAEAVLDSHVDYEIAAYRDQYLSVRDAPALAELTGLTMEELTGHRLSFESDGAVIVPWPVALQAAKALARRMPEQVIAEVEKEERKIQHEMIHGFAWSRRAPSRDVESEADIVREVDEGGYRQSRELRRKWVGAEAVARSDELVELRKEIRRVGEVAEEAVETLRRRGHSADAEWLALALGQTVDMLRADPE